MSCSGVQINSRVNADLRVGFKPAQKDVVIADMFPLFQIYSGGVSVLSVTKNPTPNGSFFEVIDDALVMAIEHRDIAVLPNADLIYDLTFQDNNGFVSWIIGGRFVVLPAEYGGGSCVVGDEPVYVQIGDTCVEIYVEGSTIGVIGDVPNDGKLYARQDKQWAEFTIPPASGGGGGGIPDAPIDGETYGRKDGDWVDLDLGRFIEDAPFDGEFYGRVNGSWDALDTSQWITDAPVDGDMYVRMDAGWQMLDLSAYLTDAPIDGKQYARKDGAWSEVASTQNQLYPVEPIDVSSLITTVKATTATLSITQSDTGAFVVRTDGGAAGEIVSLSGMPVSGEWEAIMGFTSPVFSRSTVYHRVGLGCSNGTAVIGVGYNSQSGAGEAISNYYATTNSYTSGTATPNLIAIDIMFSRIRCTATEIITDISFDGGRTWVRPLVRAKSGFFTPTSVGIFTNSFGTLTAGTLMFNVFYWKFTQN